jgi:hypothetical protein
MTPFTVFLDESDVGGEDDSKDGRTDANDIKSVGDEKERFGGDEEDLGEWGKRNDLVDQVLTLLMHVPELGSCWEWGRDGNWLEKKDGELVVGVEGGVRAEAKTSNWRER